MLRRRACEASGDDPFEETVRCYKAYVFACTSLVPNQALNESVSPRGQVGARMEIPGSGLGAQPA